MKKRILHTMLRVVNLELSVDFYCRSLGMKLLRKFENRQEGYTLSFVGYGSEESTAVIELTYNHDVTNYIKGQTFGHIAIGVENCALACEQIRDAGGKIVRSAGLLKGGEEIIAFCEDPEGNRIELIERGPEWFA